MAQPWEWTPWPGSAVARPLLLLVINKMVGLACTRIIQLTNVSVAQNYLLPVICSAWVFNTLFIFWRFFSELRAGRNMRSLSQAHVLVSHTQGGRYLGWDTGLSTAQPGLWCRLGSWEGSGEHSGAPCPRSGLLKERLWNQRGGLALPHPPRTSGLLFRLALHTLTSKACHLG